MQNNGRALVLVTTIKCTVCVLLVGYRRPAGDLLQDSKSKQVTSKQESSSDKDNSFTPVLTRASGAYHYCPELPQLTLPLRSNSAEPIVWRRSVSYGLYKWAAVLSAESLKNISHQ